MTRPTASSLPGMGLDDMITVSPGLRLILRCVPEASRALLQLAKDLGLHRALYSRTEPWVESALAMIVGRIVYQGSKLSLCNQWPNTCLWELCGVEGRPDVEDHCYLPMDRLLQRQSAIQKKLAAKHLKQGRLVLYDITSTYFEGEYKDSKLVDYGYNRFSEKRSRTGRRWTVMLG